MSLQGNKETPVKELFHIKIFEPNYSFSEYKTLNVRREKLQRRQQDRRLLYIDALHMQIYVWVEL